MKKFLKYHLVAIIWGLIILLLCGLPGSSFPKLDFWELLTFDKFAHAFFFGVLVVLIIVAQIKQYRFHYQRYKAVRIAFITGVVYGGLIELLQGYVLYQRTADIFDFIANVVGCLLGVFTFYIIYGNKVLTNR